MNVPTTTLGFFQLTVQYVWWDKDGREVSVAISLRPERKDPLKFIASFFLLPYFATVTFTSEM